MAHTAELQRLDELVRLHAQLASMLTQQRTAASEAVQEAPDSQLVLECLEDIAEDLGVSPEQAAQQLVQDEADVKDLFDAVSAIDNDIAKLKRGDDTACSSADVRGTSPLQEDQHEALAQVEALEQRIAECHLEDAQRKDLLQEAAKLAGTSSSASWDALWERLAAMETALRERQHA